MKTVYYLIFVQFLALNFSFAQDYHLAQYDANPLNLNPALTGERLTELKGIQVNGNYRNQIANYSSAPGSFKSFSVGLDIPINSKFAIGQYFGNNKSGDGVYNSNNFMFSTSYKINNSDNSDKQNFSVGCQFGIINTSFVTRNFTYGSQYSPAVTDGFDKNIASGENLNNLNSFKFNMNLGIYYRTTMLDDRFVFYSGASVYNISSAETSVNTIVPIPLKFNINIGGIYKVDDKLSVQPSLLYMYQTKASELNIGGLLHYKLNKDYVGIFGAGYRNKNALILNVGLKVNGYTFRASYCAVNGTLINYRNKGIEFSILHTSPKKVKVSKTPL